MLSKKILNEKDGDDALNAECNQPEYIKKKS